MLDIDLIFRDYRTEKGNAYVADQVDVRLALSVHIILHY